MNKSIVNFNYYKIFLVLLLFSNITIAYSVSTKTNNDICLDTVLNQNYQENSKELYIPTEDNVDNDYHLEKIHDEYGTMYINIWGKKRHSINFVNSKIKFIDNWVQEVNKATRILRKICRNLEVPDNNHLCIGESQSLCSRFQNVMVSENSIIGNPIDLKAMNYIYKLQDSTSCKAVNINCVYLNLAIEFMETLNENTLVILEKLQNLSEIYRALENNQFFDRILALRNLATNHTALADMVAENLQLQDIIDNKLEKIKSRRLILEQNKRILEYSGMWSSITAPIVSIFPSLSRTLGFTVHEAIDGLNLPDIGDSIGQTVGGIGSGLVGGLSKGLGIGWKIIIAIGFMLILSYILNIFKLISNLVHNITNKNNKE